MDAGDASGLSTDDYCDDGDGEDLDVFRTFMMESLSFLIKKESLSSSVFLFRVLNPKKP